MIARTLALLLLAWTSIASAQTVEEPLPPPPPEEALPIAAEPEPQPEPPAAEPEPAAEEEEEEEEGPHVDVSAEPGRGFTISVGDVFGATLRARMQLRNTTAINGEDVTDNVEIRALRISLLGNVFDRSTRYSIQIAVAANDFEPENPSPLLDAYLESTHLRELNFRAGQFFVPFDRARTVRDGALMTVDRTDVLREFTLDRDVGLMISSSDFLGLGGILGYSIGVFGGDGRNRISTPGEYPGFLYAGRVSVRPMGEFDDDQESDLTRGENPRLALGIGFAYNTNTDRPRSTTGTRTQQIYIRARPDYLHFAADITFKWAGFSFLSEVLWREADRNAWDTVNSDGDPITEYSRSGWGYFVQAGQLIWEGLELWVRWEHLLANEGTAPDLIMQANDRGHGLAAGVNYYIHGHPLKVQADWVHAFGDDFLGGTHQVHLQLEADF